MRSKVTIADVAREANVSTQTVSRVVNHKDGIRPSTRQAVLDVIDRLGYRPNIIARSLVTTRTSTLGMVVPDIGNPFFAEMVRGAEDAAREHGYHLMVCNTDQLPEREEEAILALEDKWVDGIVLCSSRLPEDRLRAVLSRRQGVVLTGRMPVEGAVGSVRDSDEEVVRLALQHLLSRGKRSITFLAGWPGGPAHALRAAAFKSLTSELGLTQQEAHIALCVTNTGGGYESATKVLQQRPDTDGLICFNDLVAIGAIRACLEQGRRVPEDVHIVGFDDNVLAGMVVPPLTTVRRSMRGIGHEAVDMMVKHLRNEEHPFDRLLPLTLVVRESSP
jgi:LacI family transcriptional regulator